MVASFNEELLGWYLITLRLRQAMEAGLPRPPWQKKAELQWAVTIIGNLEQARKVESSRPWAKISIYRVPISLRGSEDECHYTPMTVSIGPFHRGAKQQLRAMELHKWRALQMVLRRSGHHAGLYFDAARALERRARACYEGGGAPLSAEQFAEAMVLDGLFMLELFRGVAAAGGFEALGYSPHDPVFAMNATMRAAQRDMLLLENQIPMFVLDRLLGLQLGEPAQRGMAALLAARFFSLLSPTGGGSGDIAFDPLPHRGLHCLDFLRRSLLRTGGGASGDGRKQQMVPCVTELKKAGVSVRRRKGRFWDIRFSNGVLQIPRLLVHDCTRSLFLNLIAFEQCHLQEARGHITAYVVFMDNLINSGEDVGFLHQRGVLEHSLGSDEEVAGLVNRLCRGVTVDGGYLAALSAELNRHCGRRWNVWRATLWHHYFSSPWAIISFVAAVLLLILTFLQTFYGVYSYYRGQ
ncbi:unnamed protein product [Spirodela intermedia]|uniref:Uncharacterized protein n=1 Tax=Spirodela intermedia TaxID=51605 RepID=A0A7I8LD93_SPIIN|nr:unnamed protein product [Spirodela intermedia]